ncbi:MAG TPA: protein kinase [Polyangiaceae bacterium]|jgi:serine/threonine-protein kinase|nr:protein kinase [Polyangiaceae bacterium]
MIDPTTPSAVAPNPPSQPPPSCAPGSIVAQKYRVERVLGVGGMAQVFEATHLGFDQRVALKVLRFDRTADNAAMLARFDREARAAAMVSGEATARVMDVGALEDGAPYLVMEYLEGRDLESVLADEERIPVETAVGYVIQACEGLAETHAAGIVHRDLKPSNLFVTRGKDGTMRVKLLDFGISKFAGPAADGRRLTTTRELVGSPVYMSPEQMRSSARVDARTDIWSLGVILYELLGDGASPFNAATLPEICARVLDEAPRPLLSIRPDVPRKLDALVMRCLEKNPARRFQTVAALAKALVRFGPPDARARLERIRRILAPEEHVERGFRAKRLRRTTTAAMLAAALMGLGVTASWSAKPARKVPIVLRPATAQAATPSPRAVLVETTPLAPLQDDALATPPAISPDEAPVPAIPEIVVRGAPPETAPHPSSPRSRHFAFAIAEFGGRQ